MKTKRALGKMLRKLSWSVAVWLAAAFVFGFIRVWGVESLPAFERVTPLQMGEFLLDLSVLGLSIGIPFGIMDLLLDSKVLRKRSYWQIIFLKSLLQILLAFFSLYVLVMANQALRSNLADLFSFIFSKTALIWIIYTGMVSFMIYFVQVMKSKIGNRVLINLLLGKYHNPRVESRIFMFLDMKDSTTHAEKLGHVLFSSLIQDSMNDLTKAITEHKVEVYQYVGDEAVLTWSPKNGLENANCLNAYFTFSQTLSSRHAYYENKYGFVPFFKAGVHLGEVTVSEVGAIKREIAYHSDVLNTAARIQGKCNEFEAALLISEDLKNSLTHQQPFDLRQIGGINLKGKQKLVNIYQVRPIQNK
jgi:adenylate cyclase